ncbi:MAG: DNA polymerase IV [Methanobacterium paludis]|nr:DNA polymerase IV [Methanobacterium paludis]
MTQSTNSSRIIFHVDMNSFYASVEVVLHPEWRGKPLAIAGKPEERHGIVVTSSYEARKRGVRTTMTIQEAIRKCPELIVKHPDFGQYRAMSDRLFQFLRGYTALVEKASIDEGYMDMTDHLSGNQVLQIAEEIQHRIKTEFGIPCSIGIAPNKFLAKMASNMKKPMGITILRKRQLSKQMWPLAVDRMHGVGPKTAEQMKKSGIRTIGQLAAAQPEKIEAQYGVYGKRLYEHANGQDDRPVDPGAWDRYKSIGHSVTLPRDSRSMSVISDTIDSLSEKVADKIRKEHIVSYELTVMIRYQDWETVTRQRSVVQPLSSKKEIRNCALHLFQKNWNGKAVRLLGITLSAFKPLGASTKQLDLFTYEQDAEVEPIVRLVEQVNEKFGDGALKSAAVLFDNLNQKASDLSDRNHKIHNRHTN